MIRRHMTDEKKGLASADEQTREEVARKGGVIKEHRHDIKKELTLHS